MLFNEIYILIFEKNKVTEAHQRSVLQLMSVINRDEKKDLVRAFKANAKIYLTLEEKNYSPICRAYPFFSKKSRMASYKDLSKFYF